MADLSLYENVEDQLSQTTLRMDAIKQQLYELDSKVMKRILGDSLFHGLDNHVWPEAPYRRDWKRLSASLVASKNIADWHQALPTQQTIGSS